MLYVCFYHTILIRQLLTKSIIQNIYISGSQLIINHIFDKDLAFHLIWEYIVIHLQWTVLFLYCTQVIILFVILSIFGIPDFVLLFFVIDIFHLRCFITINRSHISFDAERSTCYLASIKSYILFSNCDIYLSEYTCSFFLNILGKQVFFVPTFKNVHANLSQQIPLVCVFISFEIMLPS